MFDNEILGGDLCQHPPMLYNKQSLIWEQSFNSKICKRSADHFGSHFVHNGQAHAAPLVEYTGQQNCHKKGLT